MKFSAKSYPLNEHPSILCTGIPKHKNWKLFLKHYWSLGYSTVNFCFQKAAHFVEFLIRLKTCCDSSYRGRTFKKLIYYKPTFLEWCTRYGLLCSQNDGRCWKGALLNPQMEGSQLSLQSTPGTPSLAVKETAFKVSCTKQIAVQQKPGRSTD